MKTIKFILVLISIFVLTLASTTAFAQFKGKMIFNDMDKVRSFDVYYSDLGYRYEFDEDGQEGVVIVKNGSQDVIILMPEQMMAMKTPAGNPMTMANDPLQAYKYYKDSAIFSEEGEEVVNGVLCKKSALFNKENPTQKMFTVWYSEEYMFPMKMINHIDGSEDSKMEMKDVEPWIPDPAKFEIPSDFQVMDMQSMMPNK